MRGRDRYDIHAVLAANGAKLQAQRDAVRGEMEAERADRERMEAKERSRREQEWLELCLEQFPPGVLPFGARGRA